ncbi:MAG TPA: polymer-forming cytoskeletal protein [Ktedonobacteraceae bacterium]|nr:polymer-forming cytoskeletal protein [Ktedonobacteraceae bacterium]
MRNVRRRQWCVFALSGLLLLVAFFISGGGILLVGVTPTVMAATGDVIRASGDCTDGQHGPSFGGAVVVDTNEVECGTLTTFGGTVAINGEVQGDIVAFNSDVVIAGTVDGNINLYGGNVSMQSGSHVHGDINLYGGHYTQGLNIQLGGSVIDQTQHIDWLLGTGGSFHFSFWVLFVWVGLGLLLTSLLPEHVMIVRTTVVSKTRRSLVLGLLTIPLAPAVLVVLVALVLSIPLAIIVGLGLIAAWGLGTVAIGWLIGDYILGKVAPHYNTRLKQIVVGLTVLVLAGSLPYIGWLISIGAGLLGLGAVFLSRFGTRLYSQPKQPITL